VKFQLNFEDYYKRTPLSLVVDRRRSPFLVAYLAQKGAKLPVKHEMELPPLQSSTLYGEQNFLRIFSEFS
jgi:hypothetical protein